ncbi:MAG TPA: hypothetical protein VK892_01170 [Pyrinomonadaceae bacterium]|nr:hypothetical protein [Pyrinomonadaceae bacterium]
MKEPIFKYDELSDTMYVSFAPGETGTGIELNEHILLRINETEKYAIGLTLFDYSVLAQPTEIGYRSLPLGGLADLPGEMRELVIEILHTFPVREILSLSAYTPSTLETIPITSLQHSVLERKAA